MSRVFSPGPVPGHDDGLPETLARIARLGEGYELQVAPARDGWLPAEALIGGGPQFERAIERLRVVGADPQAQRAIGSQFVLLYLRFVWPVVAAFALERRVPDVAAANLMVRLDDAGWPSAFAMTRPNFAALEEDPAARDASFVARDEAELVRWLHVAAVDRNAAPLIETTRRRLYTSGTALWGNVAAAFAHPLLWHVQHVAAESTAVVRDAEALLARGDAPRLNDQVRLLRMVEGGEEWVVHARRTCCLRWCLPGESRCADCPLVREPQAGEFLREHLAEAIARGEALRNELGLRAWVRPRKRESA
ncbi:MAG: IucA/IucC family C-terminal-domain containing protein [Candidatus Limnocylindria bacterium]